MNAHIVRYTRFFLGAMLLQVTALERLAADEEAKDRSSVSKLQQVALAMHLFHSAHARFPAHASYNKEGEALLSWRVHLLPFLGEKTLYDEFRRNEPWDSPHNKKLIAEIPHVYAGALKETTSSGRTRFLVPLGPQHIFTGKRKGVPSSQITDGLATTIMVVEVTADRAVIWTRPEDLKVDTNNPARALFEQGRDRFNAAFADGRTRQISRTTTPKELLSMFTRNATD